MQDLGAPLPLLLQQTATTGDRDSADEALLREFVWGLDLVSQTESRARSHGRDDRDESGEAWSAPLVDGLGSTRLQMDIRGRVGGTYAYTAYGVPLPGGHEDDREAGGGSVFGFAGEQLDARTGLVDLRARWYDPQVGRFLRQDSLLHGGPGSQGFNRFAYGVNNPVRYTDPSGHFVPVVVAGGLALAGALGLEITADAVVGTLVAGMFATTIVGGAYVVAHHHPAPTPSPVQTYDRPAHSGPALGTYDHPTRPVPDIGAVDGLPQSPTATNDSTCFELPWAGADDQLLAARTYPRDRPGKNQKNWSAWFDSEAEARQLAREKLGRDPVQVEPYKWRSRDGKWQYRARPQSVAQGHINLEELDPNTGEVLQDLHLRWPTGTEP